MNTRVVVLPLLLSLAACSSGATSDEIRERSVREVPIDTTITYVRNREVMVCSVQQATIAGMYRPTDASASSGVGFGVTFIIVKDAPNGELLNVVAGHPVALMPGTRYLIDYRKIPTGVVSPTDIVNLEGHGLTTRWIFQEGLHADAVLMDNPRPLKSDSTNVYCTG